MKESLLIQSFKTANRENRPALLTYTVAGDNTKKKSLEILKSISKYADICELGFPHNTPIADGGQIQTSSYRAIKNGIKINDVFSIAKQFKKQIKDKPIILMGNKASTVSVVGKLLKDNGFEEVFCLDGGIQSWIEAGLPVRSTEK